MRRRVIVTALALLVAGGAVDLLASQASASQCPTVQFVGVRGSGERSQYGVTIGDIARRVVDQVPGAAATWIDYPAIAVGYGGWNHYPFNYPDSVAAGMTNLGSYINRFLSGPCAGTTPLLLAGYSQGAHVVGDVVDDWLTPAQRARVAGVALLGDPRFQGDQRAINVGSFDSAKNGAYWPRSGGRTIHPDMSNKYYSYCKSGDPVCNFTISNTTSCVSHPTSCPHSHYIDSRLDASNYTYTSWVAFDLAYKYYLSLGSTSTTTTQPRHPPPRPGNL
jgi:hypothetical protein